MMLPIDSGTASVAGSDVAREPKQVRQRLGSVSQACGADDLMDLRTCMTVPN